MVYNVQPPYNIVAVNDVTASRLFGNDYTNSTGRTLFVTVSGFLDITLAGGNGLLTPFIGGVAGIRSGIQAGGIVGQTFHFMVSFEVPPGAVYQVLNSFNNAVWTLIRWMEAY